MPSSRTALPAVVPRVCASDGARLSLQAYVDKTHHQVGVLSAASGTQAQRRAMTMFGRSGAVEDKSLIRAQVWRAGRRRAAAPLPLHSMCTTWAPRTCAAALCGAGVDGGGVWLFPLPRAGFAGTALRVMCVWV
jgi:hypothetical protein